MERSVTDISPVSGCASYFSLYSCKARFNWAIASFVTLTPTSKAALIERNIRHKLTRPLFLFDDIGQLPCNSGSQWVKMSPGVTPCLHAATSILRIDSTALRWTGWVSATEHQPSKWTRYDSTNATR